jgi:hypothetical protein
MGLAALFVCVQCALFGQRVLYDRDLDKKAPGRRRGGKDSYQYYYTDHLASVDATKWVKNGSISAGSGGLTSSASGLLISSVAVPDGSGNYEVKMTLALTTNGGNFFSYLRASSNSLANSSLGTFYCVIHSVSLQSCQGHQIARQRRGLF